MVFYISIIFILKYSFLTSSCKQNTDCFYHRKRIFHRNMTGDVLVNPITEVFLKKYPIIFNFSLFIREYCIFRIIFFVQHFYHLICKVIFILFVAIVYLLYILFDFSILRLNLYTIIISKCATNLLGHLGRDYFYLFTFFYLMRQLGYSNSFIRV